MTPLAKNKNETLSEQGFQRAAHGSAGLKISLRNEISLKNMMNVACYFLIQYVGF